MEIVVYVSLVGQSCKAWSDYFLLLPHNPLPIGRYWCLIYIIELVDVNLFTCIYAEHDKHELF